MRWNGRQGRGRGRTQPRAVVVGGSVGGLFIANMLIRRGWDVDIFERVGGELASRGAGIARHYEMITIMAAAGAKEGGELGIAVDGRTAYDKSGRIIARYDYPQHLTAWSQVYNQLHAAFPREHYHLSRELVGIRSSGATAIAQFADRAEIKADLIVGADGFRSTVRSLVAPETVPLYGGYVAWRGLMAEIDLSKEFRTDTFNRFSFCFPPKSQFIGYPLLGADDSIEPGRRRYSFLWYYPIENGDALADILTDETGRRYDYSIPPPLIRRTHIAKLQEMARELLPPQFAEVVTHASQYMVQPIYDVQSTRISFDNVVLLGDAAFVARPHVGVGVLKAGQDALALADALSERDSIAEGLERYESIRLPCGRDAVRLGRHLGSFIERGLPGPWADPSLNLTPETIIRVSARPVDQISEAKDPVMTAHTRTNVTKPIPFDTARLDALLDDAGIDLLIATSKHNVQYLLGGYRFFFFDYMDAIGMSRYLPIFVYRKGKPEHSAYIGNTLEKFEHELDKFWPPAIDTSTWVSTDAMRLAVAHIRGLGDGIRTIGLESAFLPVDCGAVIRQGLGNCEVVDALFPLERLRARKTPEELTLLREASERVVASMLAVFGTCVIGDTKRELVERLRREEVDRGLTFEYCLITAGTSLNRAPSDQKLQAGDILSLDSGGNYHGYIGDLCRMGILGEPDAELEDLLSAIEDIQQAARKPIRASARGGDIFAIAQKLLNVSPHREYTDFLAHGMGLVSHEAPRLTTTGPVPYSGYDENRGLESGMVVSIETTMAHPKRGFIKLEDTIVVTGEGYEGLGDIGRGWNRAGDGAAQAKARGVR